MNIKSIFHVKTIFQKFFISYMLMATILVILVSSLLFQRFSGDSIKQINRILQKTLMQSQTSVEYIMDQAISTCYQLMSDNDVIQQMNLDSRDTMLENKLLRSLNDIISLNRSLYSICIYNRKNDSFLSTDSGYEENETVKWLEKSDIKICSQVIPRKVKLTYENGKEKNIYSVFYYDRSELTDILLDAIIVNIKEDSIRKAINDLNTEENARALILDEKGLVVSGWDEYEYLKDLSGMHFVNELISLGNKSSGNLVDTLNGERVLITYNFSKKLSWYFIYIIPYDQAIGSVYNLLNAVVIVSLTILVFSLIFSAFVSGKISSPFRKIANNILKTENTLAYGDNNKIDETEIISRYYLNITHKIEKLENYRQYSNDRLKADLLKDILNGMKDLNSADLTDVSLDLDISGGSGFVTAVIRIDKMIDLRDGKPAEIDGELLKKIESTICLLAVDTLRERFKCEATENEYDIVLLVNTSGNQDSESFMELLGVLQRKIKNYIDISVSIGIGTYKHNFSLINEAYKTALMATNYRIVNGEGTILVYDEIIDNIRNEFEYPYNKEKVLLDSIRSGKAEQIEPALNDIFGYLKDCHYDFIILSVNHLLFSVYLTAENLFGTYSGDSLKLFEKMLVKVRMLETLDQIRILMLNYISFKLQKNIERRNTNSDIVKQIEEMISENLSNSGLSVEMVANKFNYNPTYFGKLFREFFSKSFLEYVAELKIEKANEYLKSNKLTIKEISVKTGFNNPTYFVTWYKKNTGFSPSEYRQKTVIGDSFKSGL